MRTKLFSLFLFLLFLAQCSEPQNLFWEIMHNPPKVFLDAMKGDRHPDAKIVAPGLFDHSRPYYEIYSTARNQFVGTIGGELYFRNLKSEEYAQRLEPKNGWFWHIDNAMWSPNGNYVIAKQINDKGVPTIELTHGSSTDVTYKKYSRAGEKIPSHQFYVIELETLQITPIEQDPEFPYVHLMDWHSNNSNAFFVEADRLMKEMRLLKINIKTGEKTVILKEYSETYLIGLDLLQLNSRRLIDRGLFTLLQDREQFIWLSERSGFYQLYLYDLEGNFIRSLTNGILDKIVSIDSKDNWLYYTTHADTTKPYNLQLYRSSLKENNIQKLSNLEGVIDVFVSENKDSLFVLRSGLPALMQMEAYSMNGDFYGTTWKGNLSSIEKSYLNAEYIKVFAADNKTEIETLILKPQDFSAKKKYPIVEYIYGGNFSNEVIRDLLDPKLWQMQDLANEGFIVAFIDGRGTPKRGREFRNFSYGKIGQVEIQDHVAALKQIGKDRPYMDMNKIGIIGHSWGGHFAIRALLEAPDFYKAGHINAAGFDPINFRIAVEAFMGCLPQDCPQSYEQSNISDKLSNLKAPLMIMHGTADDDVPIEESYKLVAKLKELNYNNYEFIEYQGVNHIIMRHPDWNPTMIDFFVKELQNRD